MKLQHYLLTMAFVLQANSSFTADTAPTRAFDLQDWKLQVPGPKEIKKLQGYSSDYFHLNAAKEMCFCLDAAEKGATPNAKYVRSELRHLPNWKTGETHSMSAEFRAVSKLTPDKVTTLQIHGITADGQDAPPLLRVAVNRGDLVAALKTDSEGESKTDMVVLKPGLGSGWVKVDITVKQKELVIAVDGQVKLKRGLAFWKFDNYFKAGCYPQATQGAAEVMFRKLRAE
jgi:Alginate lyase